MFSKKKGVTETSQLVQPKCFQLRWLVALGSPSVYGRVFSLITTANSHVTGVDGQRPITSEREWCSCTSQLFLLAPFSLFSHSLYSLTTYFMFNHLQI